MVSASRTCLPRLNSNQVLLLRTMEGVSRALTEGHHGTQAFINTIKNPVSSIRISNPPVLDTKGWASKCYIYKCSDHAVLQTHYAKMDMV